MRTYHIILTTLLCLGLILSISCSEENNPVNNAPSITVTAPNGGEIWHVGTTQDIVWVTTGNIPHIDIECTYDGGTNWEVILDSTDNSGTLSWKVKDTTSTECMIRISDAYDGNPADMSNGTFTIQPLRPHPGPWSGNSSFGTISFIVSEDSTMIEEISYNFSNYGCGGNIVGGTHTIENPSGWPITSAEIDITNDLTGGDYTITITGTFLGAGNWISGRFTAVIEGTTCTGSWTATPEEVSIKAYSN